MNVLIIGGTGFIGFHVVKEFLKQGYQVRVLALPDLPIENLFPPEVDIILDDLHRILEDDICDFLQDQEAVVFAAGVDDRTLPKSPAYPFFYHGNVVSCQRLFKLARQCGIKRGVILGSYFAHFDRIWPQMALSKHHPYIRSRQEQITASLQAAAPDLELMILELPYIFGAMPGRIPLWKPLIRYITSPLPVLFYPRGGTNMIAVKHVAEAIVGAIEQGEGGQIYQIGDENLTWSEFLGRVSKLAGQKKKVVTLPNWMIRTGMGFVNLFYNLQGRESGLDPVPFVDLQTTETFFDPTPSRAALGYGTGGLDQAFKETIAASLEKLS